MVKQQGYLERYAEPEIERVPELTTHYDHVLVVPCFDEAPNCLVDVVENLTARVLVIAVINTPTNATPEQANRTRTHWCALTGNTDDASALTALTQHADVLAIDRTLPDHPIPKRQGVGLARKIGADVALACIRRGAVRSPWIYLTDADARLPSDYFTPPPPAAGCLVYPFRHSMPPAIAERVGRYELHLRYYVNRLQSAGSPYGYHTLGSTIAIRADVLEAVRGVPKRNAAEDFYLLNKSAKVAPIYVPATQPIELAGRVSHRVPFGTGPALANMNMAESYTSYAPESFELLAEALRYIESLGETPLSRETKAVLSGLGFQAFIASARRQYKRPETLRKALHQWFDAFRSLRFVHEARHFHPDVPLSDSLDKLFGSIDHGSKLVELERSGRRWFGVTPNPPSNETAVG